MLVSVVVPTRNRAHLLRVAIRAIAAQTHRDVEVIVVDDGSSTQHAAANQQCLSDAAPLQTRYVYLGGHNPAGSGPSYARNAGVAQARGELLAFCDDDDLWTDERHLEVAVAAFTRDAELDLHFADQAKCAQGKVVPGFWQPDLVAKLSPIEPDACRALSRADALLTAGEFAHMNTCVFRRTLWDKTGGFWEGVRYAEDVDLFVRAVSNARGITYRHTTVSMHNIPDRKLQANASTLLSESAKKMALIHIANHLLLLCNDAPARDYARTLAGHSYRWLTQAAVAERSFTMAHCLGRLASAWRMSPKWLAYVWYLRLKAR